MSDNTSDNTDEEATHREDVAEKQSQKSPVKSSTSTKKKTKTICEMVRDGGLFEEMEEPGPLQHHHLGPDTELFLFTVPSTTHVRRLIGKEVVVGGTRQQEVTLGQQHLTLESFPSPSLGTTLFLPNHSGQLHIASVGMTGQVVVRDQCRYLSQTPPINLDHLRSVVHQPPTDLRDRNFFVGPGSNCAAKKKKQKKQKKDKKQKENKTVKEEEVSPAVSPLTCVTSQEHVACESPGKVKTKKRKRKSEVEDVMVSEQTDVTHVVLSPAKKKKKKK